MEEQDRKAIEGNRDGGQEGGTDDSVESRQAATKKLELILSVLKEAVSSAGIRDISEYKGEPLHSRWHVFSLTTDRDVILKLLVQGAFGTISADVSLFMAAGLVVDEVELILNRPDAQRTLDFTDEERPQLLREHVRMILTGYVKQIGVVAFQIMSQAFDDAIQSHLKTYVEPVLKEHWKSLGLPEDYTIAPSDEFTNYQRSVGEQFNAIRQGFLGNKRAWLTREKRAALDEEHEQLRAEYQVAKDHYNRTRKAFFAGKRNRTEGEWVDEWNTQSHRMFPNLHFRCLAEINDYPPYELAYIHLADSYGYSPDYIRKLVTQASGLKSSKS